MQTSADSDVIFIREFRFETLIGIHKWEKQVRQTIELDIEIGISSAKAAASNDVRDTIDYGRVIARIREMCKQRHFPLLESLAQHLATLIITEFGASRVKLSVSKLGLFSGVKRVGVTIERLAESQGVNESTPASGLPAACGPRS